MNRICRSFVVFGISILIICCLCIPKISLAGDDDLEKYFKRTYKITMAHIFYDEYDKALPNILELLENEPNNANFHCLAGLCYLNANQNNKKAIEHLLEAIKNTSPAHKDAYKAKDASIFAFYYLGLAYQSDKQYERALSNFQLFQEFIPSYASDIHTEVEQQKTYCNNSESIVNQPLDAEIVDSPIKTKYSSYSAQLTTQGDLIYFSSRVEPEGGADEYTVENELPLGIFYMQKDGDNWLEPKSVIEDEQEGNHLFCCVSHDGKYMFFTSDIEGDWDIYYKKLSDNGEWSKPTRMGDNINSKYDETYVTMSRNGEHLYFISNRKEGQGGSDIYLSEIITEDNWTKAQNIGANINTEFEEESPFISADEQTLYFSSQGHNSIGGFDIFYSKKIDGMWSTPENIGYPINTMHDDLYFRKSFDNKTAFYTSPQKGNLKKAEVFQINDIAEALGEAPPSEEIAIKESETTEDTTEVGELGDFLEELLTEESEPIAETIPVPEPEPEPIPEVKPKGLFYVQVGAGKNLNRAYFSKLDDVIVCKNTEGLFIFLSGGFETREETEAHRSKIKALGYPVWIRNTNLHTIICE